MSHRRQSRIKGDKCVDPICFWDERRVVDENKLLTTVVQPQPVKIHVDQCEINWSQYPYNGKQSLNEFRGSCVICGQLYLPCAEKEEKERKKEKKKKKKKEEAKTSTLPTERQILKNNTGK